ncbi:DUF1330 domain-containing protein [Kineosporia mesophila]|nr:DUF1330 domain-containing protein [Kineosporia mesophila]MCD5350262.1 DUF1330 domain-containing protein [Kineosporia mesophila]
MTAYAIAHLTHVIVNDEVIEYLRRIDSTLEPFGASSWCTAHRCTNWKRPGRETSW